MSTTDRRLRLAAVGDNCVDIIGPAGRRLIGGNAVNVAVQWVGLGGIADYIGAVGEDADGDLTERVLAANGVLTRHLVRRRLATAYTLIEVDPSGERRIGFEDFGACVGFTPDAAAEATLLAADHVHIGWLDDGGALRRRLVAAGRSVSQDVSVNAAPENLDVDGLAVAFASVPGSHAMAARLASHLFARGARGVVVTRGAEGSSVFLGSGEAEIAAVPIRPVDTTGAGDAYIAAFLHALLSGETPARAGAAGAARAAAACLHEGGFPQADSG